jgi:hypothetical protein
MLPWHLYTMLCRPPPPLCRGTAALDELGFYLAPLLAASRSAASQSPAEQQQQAGLSAGGSVLPVADILRRLVTTVKQEVRAGQQHL